MLDYFVSFIRKCAVISFLKVSWTIVIVFGITRPTTAQDIYKYKDDKGQWKFESAPSPAAQRESIVRLPQSVGDCTPFAMGEARELKPSSSSSDTRLRVVSLQVKLVDASFQVAHFSWRLQIRSLLSQKESVYGNINFLDCSGFLLGRGGINKTGIDAGQSMELVGQGSVWGKTANRVGRFSVEVSGTSVANPPVQLSPLPLPFAPARPPQPGYVRLQWSRLVGVVGDSYVSGEVVNTGSGPANGVRVRITVFTSQGAVAATGTTETSPPTLPPGARASFRQRVTIPAMDGYSAKVEPQWSPEPGISGYGGFR